MGELKKMKDAFDLKKKSNKQHTIKAIFECKRKKENQKFLQQNVRSCSVLLYYSFVCF